MSKIRLKVNLNPLYKLPSPPPPPPHVKADNLSTPLLPLVMSKSFNIKKNLKIQDRESPVTNWKLTFYDPNDPRKSKISSLLKIKDHSLERRCRTRFCNRTGIFSILILMKKYYIFFINNVDPYISRLTADFVFNAEERKYNWL